MMATLFTMKIINNNIKRPVAKYFNYLILNFGPIQTIQTASNPWNCPFTYTVSHLNSNKTSSEWKKSRYVGFCSKAYSNMAHSANDEKLTLISVEEAKRFVIDCFKASETDESHAQQMADLLIEADVRGHFSHGMNRLAMYINDLHMKVIDGRAKPKVLNESVATAWVDGNNALGAVVGNYCMELAMSKAKAVGVGVVIAKGSNHYGIAGWYTTMAQRDGLIGMSMTNTSPIMCPTRSKQPTLGTNPISFAAPAQGDDAFVLDMATTTVAIGKVEMKRRKNEPCPIGWAQDTDGKPVTDSAVAYDASCLMPLGGAEETSGFKGYGLGTMVETLCGALSGSAMSHDIRKWSLDGNEDIANLGQTFIAIDPNFFAPGFRDRESYLLNSLRNVARVDPEVPVIVAGDRSREHRKEVKQNGGIPYIRNQIKTCEELAKRLNISPIQAINKVD